jgi:hypothetical protein
MESLSLIFLYRSNDSDLGGEIGRFPGRCKPLGLLEIGGIGAICGLDRVEERGWHGELGGWR